MPPAVPLKKVVGTQVPHEKKKKKPLFYGGPTFLQNGLLEAVSIIALCLLGLTGISFLVGAKADVVGKQGNSDIQRSHLKVVHKVFFFSQ